MLTNIATILEPYQLLVVISTNDKLPVIKVLMDTKYT